MLIKSGAPLKLIHSRGSHSSASMTLQVYSRMMPGMEEAIVAAIPLPGAKRVAEWSQEASGRAQEEGSEGKEEALIYRAFIYEPCWTRTSDHRINSLISSGPERSIFGCFGGTS